MHDVEFFIWQDHIDQYSFSLGCKVNERRYAHSAPIHEDCLYELLGAPLHDKIMRALKREKIIKIKGNLDIDEVKND